MLHKNCECIKTINPQRNLFYISLYPEDSMRDMKHPYFFYVNVQNKITDLKRNIDNCRTLKPPGVVILDSVRGCQTGVEEMATTGKNIKITLKIVPY